MKAFVCVYQHPDPRARDRLLTAAAAASDEALDAFLAAYDSADCFYDWGDDPAFFAASHFAGDPCAASWGVCRRDVRAQMKAGDFVVWFCGKTARAMKGHWTYYFIGCCTVAETITRGDLWAKSRYRTYRRFYNTLVRPAGGKLRHHEVFHQYHEDWRKRAEAPYVLFDTDPRLSSLNLRSPVCVAHRTPDSLIERWRSGEDPRVGALENALFNQLGITRRLRTNSVQRPHRQIPLHTHLSGMPAARAKALKELRSTVIRLAAHE